MMRDLKINQPFDLTLSLMMGQAFRWQHMADGWFSGVVGENLYHIRQSAGVSGSVEYRIGGSHGERDATDADDEMLLHYFREDDDLAFIYADISRDPVVAGLVRQYPGMRVLRQERWECLVSFICSAQNKIPKIRQCVDAIAKHYGKEVRLDTEIRHTFPTPDQLARADVSVLRRGNREGGLGLGKSAKYIVATAKLMCDGEIDLEAHTWMDYCKSIRDLERFDGVGPKVANCISLMAMDKLEAFPVDIWVLRAMERWYADSPRPQNPKLPSSKEYKEIVQWAHDRFGQYAGYAGQYLFHGIEPSKQSVSEQHENRSRLCQQCGASFGEACYTPRGYRYEKGHGQR